MSSSSSSLYLCDHEHDILDDDGELVFACKICGEVNERIGGTSVLGSSVPPAPSLWSTCSDCKQRYAGTFRRHIRICTARAPSSPEQRNDYVNFDDYVEPIVCRICSKEFEVGQEAEYDEHYAQCRSRDLAGTFIQEILSTDDVVQSLADLADSNSDSISVYDRIMEEVNKRVPECIAKHTPASRGLGGRRLYPMKPDDVDLIRQMNPLETPIYSICSLTIPIIAYIANPLKFTDFDLTMASGIEYARIFAFLTKAFCAPYNGTCPDVLAENNILVESFLCGRQGGMGHIDNKVSIIVECLFRDTTLVDAVDLYNETNCLGYRIWYLFHDHTFSPLSAIDKLLQKNRAFKGTEPLKIRPHASDSMIQRIRQQNPRRIDEDEEMYEVRIDNFIQAFLDNCGKTIDRDNKKRQLAATNFRKYRETHQGDPRFALEMLSLEIDNWADYYNLIVCPIHACARCSELEATCENCVDVIPLGRYLERLMGESPEHLEGVDVFQTRWTPILKGSPMYNHLSVFNGMTPTTERLMSIFDPGSTFRHTLETTALLCRGIGVDERQVAAESYFDELTNQMLFPVEPFSYQTETFYNLAKLTEVNLPNTVDILKLAVVCLEMVCDSRRKNSSSGPRGQLAQTLESNLHSDPNIAAANRRHAAHKRDMPAVIPSCFYGPSIPSEESTQCFVEKIYSPPSDAAENNTVAHNDDTLAETLKNHRIMERIRRCSNDIPVQDLLKFLKIVRRRGMSTLKYLFSRSAKTTEVVKEAGKLLTELQRHNKTAFIEVPQLTKNLESFSANFALHFYWLAEKLGILTNHKQFFLVVISTLRNSHCFHTDALYGNTIMKINILNLGTAAAGKTYVIMVVGQNMLPTSISQGSSFSGRAMNRPKYTETAYVIDEITGFYDPAQATTPEHKSRIEMVKEVTTSCSLRHEVTDLNPKGLKNPGVADRGVTALKSFLSISFLVSGNAFKVRPGEESSYESRYRIIVTASGQLRFNTKSSPPTNNPTSVMEWLTNNTVKSTDYMMMSHALHVAYVKGVAVGAFTPPDISTFTTLFSCAYSHMVKKVPSMPMCYRVFERGMSIALTLAVMSAVYVVFNSPYSPLIKYTAEGATTQPFSFDQLNMMCPYVFLPEDLAFAIVVDCMMDEYIRTDYYDIIHRIAVDFCKFDKTRPQLWNYAEYENESGERCLDTNYLACPVSIKQIINYVKALTSPSYNIYMIKYIILWLSNLVVQVPMSPLGDDVTQYTPTDVKAHENALRVRPQPGNTDWNEARLHISIGYLLHFSPDDVLTMVTNSMCYNGIRPRKIATFRTMKNMPFMLHTVDVSSRSHSLNVKTNPSIPSYISNMASQNGRLFPCPSTNFDSMLGEDIPSGTDAETFLAMRWLRKNVEIPEGMRYEYYTPKYVSKAIKDLIESLNLYRDRVQYPQDVESKCMELIAVDEDALVVEENTQTELSDDDDEIICSSSSSSSAIPRTPINMNIINNAGRDTHRWFEKFCQPRMQKRTSNPNSEPETQPTTRQRR